MSKTKVDFMGKSKNVTVFKCESCNFTCCSDVSKYKKHLQTLKHIRNTTNYHENKNPEEQHRPTDEVFCECCNLRCLYHYYNSYHVNSRKHKINLLKSQENNEITN